ncbi:hypothetical protein [Brucella anthropi]|uniref:hypothetical protein n=1 Tax=Brucella anthropi TaxID=529 RepID=UPI0012D2A2EE|nr:hypothetical protein [Brucella anthropi]
MATPTVYQGAVRQDATISRVGGNRTGEDRRQSCLVEGQAAVGGAGDVPALAQGEDDEREHAGSAAGEVTRAWH